MQNANTVVRQHIDHPDGGRHLAKVHAKYSPDVLYAMACEEQGTPPGQEPGQPSNLEYEAIERDLRAETEWEARERRQELQERGEVEPFKVVCEERIDESVYFPKSQILNAGLTGWINGLPNRVKGEGNANVRPPLQKALLDSRDRTVAVQIKDGFAVPDPKILTDDQIEYLLTQLPGDEVEVKGNPDFCSRVEFISKRYDVQKDVKHEYQITHKEQQEAIARYEERQRIEQQQQQQPGFRPA